MTQNFESSLRKHNNIPGRLFQRSKAESRAILVVEGPADERLLRQVGVECEIYIAQGRKNVIDTVELMSREGIPFAVGVIDSDFSAPDYKNGEIADIYPYDNVDLEAMLVELGALVRVMEEMGSSAKIQSQGGLESAIRFIIREAQYWAAIRRLNVEESWGIAFDEYLFHKYYIHNKSSQFQRKTEELERRICQDAGVPVSELRSKLVTREVEGRYSGKDAAKVAALMMRSYLGSQSNADPKGDMLMVALRLAGAYFLFHSKWHSGLSARISVKAAEKNAFLLGQNVISR